MAIADDSGGKSVGAHRIFGGVLASGNWLISFSPLVGPNALAAVRIFIGLMIALTVLDWYQIEALTSVATNGGYYPLNKNEFVLALSSNANARAFIYWSVVISGLMFASGAVTRLAAPALAVSLWLFALCANLGHFMTPMLLALAATAPARWGESWSIDRLFKTHVLRLPFKPVRSRLYGYPIWLCGLTIALAYSTAGLSKFWITNGAWLWDTGARWGFISDLNIAATEWALPIVNSYLLSLGASLFACLGQVIYVASCFTRSYKLKLALGVLVAIPFLIGLTLFMGLYWWPWAMLVVVLYAPWQIFDRKDMEIGDPPMTVATRHGQWLVVAATTLLTVHSFVMLLKFEFEPLISNYPMYAVPFRQGSASERAEWEQYKTYNRHYRSQIAILGANERRDVSQDFAISSVVERAKFPGLRPVSPRLRPRDVWIAVDANEPLPAAVCDDVRMAAIRLAPDGDAEAIEYRRRFYDFDEQNNLFFIPPRDILTVTIRDDACPYALRPIR